MPHICAVFADVGFRTYFQMLVDESNPEAPGKMKQFASWFTHGVPGGAALRKAI